MFLALTHWGRMTHICSSELTIIGSDNGLSPGRRQAIIWTNAGISLIGPLGTNFNENSIEIHTLSLKKIHLKCRLADGGHFVSAPKCQVVFMWYIHDLKYRKSVHSSSALTTESNSNRWAIWIESWSLYCYWDAILWSRDSQQMGAQFFHWKLCCHWLKWLRQSEIAVVIQGSTLTQWQPSTCTHLVLPS